MTIAAIAAIAAIAYYLFTFFNSVRIVSYVPQIYRVAIDTLVNLGDLMLGLINLLNAACCLTVIGLTLMKRRQFRRICEGGVSTGLVAAGAMSRGRI